MIQYCSTPAIDDELSRVCWSSTNTMSHYGVQRSKPPSYQAKSWSNCVIRIFPSLQLHQHNTLLLFLKICESRSNVLCIKSLIIQSTCCKQILTFMFIKKKKSSLYASTSVICGLKVSISYYLGKLYLRCYLPKNI